MPGTPLQLPERERIGYNVEYHRATRVGKPIEITPLWRRIKTEERLGSLAFWGAVCWAVQIATKDLANWFRLILTPGPLELAGIGLLVWLHAKWRRSVRVV